MRHRIVLAALCLLVGTTAYVELTGGWYTYRFLPTTACERFQRGSMDVWPEEPVPGQPNACLLRARRFSLP